MALEAKVNSTDKPFKVELIQVSQTEVLVKVGGRNVLMLTEGQPINMYENHPHPNDKAHPYPLPVDSHGAVIVNGRESR